MTNKEASNQINDIKTELAAHWLKKDIEALDMALSALSEELSEDGTLIVHIKDGSKVKRVLVMGDNIFGGLYYPDPAEDNTMEWIRKPRIYGVTYCSKCDYENKVDDTNFCPNCGRKAVKHERP